MDADGVPLPPPAAPPFFYATEAGVVYFADDLGHCTDVVSTGCALKLLQVCALCVCCVGGGGGQNHNELNLVC